LKRPAGPFSAEKIHWTFPGVPKPCGYLSQRERKGRIATCPRDD
jgi:hypothetical protein